MMKIATLGFGEAARAFVGGWRDSDAGGAADASVATYDIKYESATEKPALLAACIPVGVTCAAGVGEALAGREAVFSLVTADRALQAAESAAGVIGRESLYLDCNSCSPSTKKAAAAVISAAGARYVDVAVMAPVHPKRHRTPLLVATADPEAAAALFDRLGMNAMIVGSEPGQASSIKMLRSVMIKGHEALTAECLLAARRAGVENAVLASLQASDPGIDWPVRAAYNLERMMVHGGRRAAEMEEVAVTLRDLGLPDRMTLAVTDWQRQIARLSLAAGENTLADRADRILERIGS